jgi:hypothetical protein
MAEDSDRLYRAVVSLNNMGVSMLEQGRHVQAQATLADAVALLRPAFRPLAADDVEEEAAAAPQAKSGSGRSCSSRLLDVDRTMAEANQRYASVTNAAAASGTFSSGNKLAVRIAVLTSRADAADIATAVESSRPSLYPVLHPFRLELNDHETLGAAGATAAREEAALVACLAAMHNCAIATLLAAGLGAAAAVRPLRMLQACRRVLAGLGQRVAGHLQLRQQTYLDFVLHRTLVEMMLLTGGRGADEDDDDDDDVAAAVARTENLRLELDQIVWFDRFASIASALNAPAA